MGRKIYRVPMDFDFPIGESFADAHWAKHEASCSKEDHDECEVDFDQDIPKGEGWQLWQTVSDGPISPVFATADELIDWMCHPSNDPRNPGPYPRLPWAQGWRREVAEKFVKSGGWAPSAVIVDGLMMSGVEYMTREKKR